MGGGGGGAGGAELARPHPPHPPPRTPRLALGKHKHTPFPPSPLPALDAAATGMWPQMRQGIRSSGFASSGGWRRCDATPARQPAQAQDWTAGAWPPPSLPTRPTIGCTDPPTPHPLLYPRPPPPTQGRSTAVGTARQRLCALLADNPPPCPRPPPCPPPPPHLAWPPQNQSRPFPVAPLPFALPPCARVCAHFAPSPPPPPPASSSRAPSVLQLCIVAWRRVRVLAQVAVMGSKSRAKLGERIGCVSGCSVRECACARAAWNAAKCVPALRAQAHRRAPTAGAHACLGGESKQNQFSPPKYLHRAASKGG